MTVPPEEVEDLETLMDTLRTKYGVRRLYLHRKDKICEVVWAVAVDDMSSHVYASVTSYNTRLDMRLLNRPIDFAGLDWGSLVKCRTNHHLAPYAHEWENEAPAQRDWDNDLYHGGY